MTKKKRDEQWTTRIVCKYKRGNHKQHIKGQTIQWPKRKQTKVQEMIYKILTQKIKDWSTRNPHIDFLPVLVRGILYQRSNLLPDVL